MARYTVGESVVVVKPLATYGLNKGEIVEVVEVDEADADLPYRIRRKNGARAWVDAGVVDDLPNTDTPTLRDQFAMAALTGQLSNPNFDTKATAAELAKTSYGIAKAMLAAREAG